MNQRTNCTYKLGGEYGAQPEPDDSEQTRPTARHKCSEPLCVQHRDLCADFNGFFFTLLEWYTMAGVYYGQCSWVACQTFIFAFFTVSAFLPR